MQKLFGTLVSSRHVCQLFSCFTCFFPLAGFSSYIPPAERSLPKGPKDLMRATIVFSAFPSCNSQPYVLRCGCCSSFATFKRKTMEDSWFCIASQEAKKGKRRKTQLEPTCYLAKKEEKTKESKGKQLVLESQWFHRLWETLGPNILSKQSSQLLPWKTSAPPLEQRPPGPPGWNSRRMPHAGHPTATVRRSWKIRMFQDVPGEVLSSGSHNLNHREFVGICGRSSYRFIMNPYEIHMKSIQSIPCVHYIHHETPRDLRPGAATAVFTIAHTLDITCWPGMRCNRCNRSLGSPWERLRLSSLVVIQ